MDFNCPKCGAGLSVPESLAGRNATCRSCKNMIRIPGVFTPSAPPKSGNNTILIAVLAAVVVIALGGGYFMLSGSKPIAADPAAKKAVPPADVTERAAPQAPVAAANYGALGTAPAGSIAVAAIDQPASILQDWLTMAEKAMAQNPELAKTLQQLRASSLENLGIDFTRLEDYKGIGLDLNQPLLAALLEQQLNGEPKGLVLSAGVSNNDAFLALARKTAAKNKTEIKEDKSAQPAVYLADKEMAFAFQDNRVFMAVGPKEISLPAELRNYLSKKNGAPISTSENLAHAIKGVGGVGAATMYVDLQSIIASSLKTHPELRTSPYLSELRAIAIKASLQDNGAFVSMLPNAQLTKLLNPGGSCRELMARADKPLLALTLSLADPIDLIKTLTQNSNPGGYSAASVRMKSEAGINLDELGILVKNSALGISVHKASGPIPVSLLVCVKINSKDPAELKKAQAGLDFCLRKLSGLPENLTAMVQSALVDEFFIFGNAVDQMMKLAQNKQPQWMPKYGRDELISLEYFMADALEHVKKTMPQVNNGKNPFLINTPQNLAFSIVQRDGGFYYSSESGEASAATIAVAAALAIPSFSRARMAANETAALAACKAFAEAQEIYHRTDWDKDGVLEYAQSISGEYSLLETKIGANDIMLVDTKFAAAEGPPSKHPVPKAGYCFKILKEQGPNAPGGERSFLVPDPNDKTKLNMIIGYALIAYPASFGSTGHNCFMISHRGTIYQKDFGPETPQIIEKMTVFNPDQTWVPTE